MNLIGFVKVLEGSEAGVWAGWYFGLNKWVIGVVICLDGSVG